MNLSKGQMTAIIYALDALARKEGGTDYGLPTYDNAHMALMREAIREELEAGDVQDNN